MKRDRYGWSAVRIFDGYIQYVNAVHRLRPKGLAKPGEDTINVPKQCHDFVRDRPDYDGALVSRVLGDPEVIEEDDWLAFMYFRKSLEEHLRENPWEPETRAEAEPPHVEFVKILIAAVINGVSERSIQRWVESGMPHRKLGRVIFVQMTVVERWTKMKYRHKAKRHLTKRRL